MYFFGSSYIIPNVDTVVLGGTAQKGNWDTTVSQEDTKTILDNIAAVFPSIRSAPLVSASSNYLLIHILLWHTFNIVVLFVHTIRDIN